MSSRSPDRRPAPKSGAPSAGSGTLVGRAIVASIGEPWDFRSTAGDNLLTGTIVATSSPGERPEWLLCAVSLFTDGAQTVSTVAAVRRHAGAEPVHELQTQGTAAAQLLYDPTGAALTPERVRAALANQSTSTRQVFRFLVGTLRLDDPGSTPE